MNIVYLLNHFLPRQVAGTEIFTWALAKSVQQQGHKVTIIIPNYNSSKNDEYIYDGLRVMLYAEPNTIDRTLRRIGRPSDGIKAFECLIKSIQPDIVNVQELSGSSGIGIYHLRLLNKLHIKTVFTMHLARYSCFTGNLMYKGTEPCDGKIIIGKCSACALSRLPVNGLIKDFLFSISMPLYKMKLNPLFIKNKIGTALSYPYIIKNLGKNLYEIVALCDKIIVLTEWYKKVLISNDIPEKKLELIKQALPYPIQLNRRIKSYKLPIKLIFVGRIEHFKGLHLLIQALKELGGKEIYLDIYGKTFNVEFYKKWKEVAAGLTNIEWKGPLTQQEVVNTMQAYDMLVLPSTFSEMSPLVIQEAFAAGIPVLGSNVKGITEQITDGVNGLLFEYGNYKSLKLVLQKLILEPECLIKLSSGIHPPANFNEVSRKTLDVYSNVLTLNSLNLAGN